MDMKQSISNTAYGVLCHVCDVRPDAATCDMLLRKLQPNKMHTGRIH